MNLLASSCFIRVYNEVLEGLLVSSILTFKNMQPETSRMSKRLRIFKNGDESFGGRQVIISQKNVKSWDSLLAEVTRQLGSRVAVRSLHTPVNGTEIRSFEELADKLDYVAVSSGAFKKLRYSELKEKKPLKFTIARKTPEVPEVAKNKLTVPGRIREARTGAFYIFVYTNGEPAIAPVRISVPMKFNDNWNSIINEINEKMKSRGKDARSLFTLDGEELRSTEQLEAGGRYVAVGCGVKGFTRANYGEVVKPVFYVPLNKHATRNSNSQQTTPAVTWRKPPKFGMSSSSPQSGSKSNMNSSEHLRARSQQAGFGLNGNFYAKPHKSSEPKKINYDDDEGGVFRLKKQRVETRDVQEVSEDQATQEEVPVEFRATENIVEEIYNTEEHLSTANHEFNGNYAPKKVEKAKLIKPIQAHRGMAENVEPEAIEIDNGERLELTYRKDS